MILHGHLDVVPGRPEQFEPRQEGDCLFGRGALDMKGGVAMMVAALLRSLEGGRPPAGDVVLCCLADEAAGSVHGAHSLVEHHPDLCAGIRHGIG